ncbi:MAG: T9SS type A sorting domain-containing protein [Candidatus Electryonea clarkiae]|nr:T9SS type A sorting domain-containing protein [Candidatus Electryonea clarkiae]MDP8285573.1 T9SS type A sorting domain-containing protein [Candidatus Electryonea clarkiae]
MQRYTYPILAIILLIICANIVQATPYIDPLILQQQLEERIRTQPPGPNRLERAPGELDEYDYYYEWEQVLDWLPDMQVAQQGVNFGGMREGEQQMNIIQTDNTQEALRDWCRYGILTGDTTTYRENIADAWEYCLEWPAWEEEGGGNPNYYRVHNAGWGCVATMEYVRTYGDSTFLWYGDECADYLDTYRLNVNGGGTNPLSAGSGAGMLYHYGVWRNNQDWIDAAQEIAEDVRDWIEANPDRLNNYENWAMCGGTAMWGVVTALYLDDPEAGAEWIPEMAEEMDTYAGTGNWNNSWTIWYGHAWNAIHRVLGDEESLMNVIECADNLLEQDDIDDDGGVPATEDQYLNDQAWTSAYICWYALELLIDVDTDVRPQSLISPTEDDTIYIGFPVELTVAVFNFGPDTLTDVSVNLTIDDYEAEETIDLNPFTTDSITFEQTWTPTEGGENIALITVFHEDDMVHENDTLSDTITVEHGLLVLGRVFGSNDLAGKPARIDFVVSPRSEEREVLFTAQSNPDTGLFSQLVEEGTYTLEISPLIAPYAFQVIDSIEVSLDNLPFIDIALDSADILYVSQQPDGIYDHYFLYPLLDMARPVYPVRTGEQDYPVDSLEQFQTIIWSTGDLNDSLFMSADRNPVYGYLENGGSFLLTGQGLQDRWGGNFSMITRFGAADGELGVESRTLIGNRDIAIIPEDTLSIEGSNGANNQDAPDEITPTDNAVPVVFYDNSEMAAAVAFEHPDDGYRTVYCAFGVEAIPLESEVDDLIDRAGFLENVMLWLNFEENELIDHTGESIPAIYSLAAYPNPFNSTLRLSLDLPVKSPVQIKIYDLLGQRVMSWNPGILTTGTHPFTWQAENMPSGMYFVMIEADNYKLTRKIILVK